MELVLKAASALLLLFGALYPMAALYYLMRSLNRPGVSRPTSAALMVRFMLIATVPLAGILGGFSGFAPTLWESLVIRAIVYGSAAISLVGFGVLAVSGRSDRSSELSESSSSREESR